MTNYIMKSNVEKEVMSTHERLQFIMAEETQAGGSRVTGALLWSSSHLSEQTGSTQSCSDSS